MSEHGPHNHGRSSRPGEGEPSRRTRIERCRNLEGQRCTLIVDGDGEVTQLSLDSTGGATVLLMPGQVDELHAALHKARRAA